jgi:hypothetical protein
MFRDSGARIGSDLRWEPKLIQEYEATRRGFLNPTFLEWLMGFPTNWVQLEPSETP